MIYYQHGQAYLMYKPAGEATQITYVFYYIFVCWNTYFITKT